jgi:ubiquinone/menaquinone biosynthesis C-methylase UbiE
MHPPQGVSHSTLGFAHPPRNVAALGIEPGMKVADFGAGSGAYVRAIAEALLGSGTVYALDIQKDLLRRIKNDADAKGFKNVEILWGDLEEEGGSKLAKDSMDVVLISNLLFQVKDKKYVVQEARRILRPLGRLAIIDWTDSFGGLGPIKDDVVTKEDAYELARAAGLVFVKEFPAGAHHYGLVFRKTKENASGK